MNETSPPEAKLKSTLPTAADESSSITRVRWFSWLPIPVFTLAVIFLSILDIQTVFEPPFLNPMINALVFIGASGVAAYLAQRGFLAGGAPSVLLLGSGMLTFGLACLLGSIQTSLGDVNAAVTTHNIGALIAGAFHLVSAIGMPLFGAGPVRKGLRRSLSLGLYTSSLASLGIVAVVAWYGIFPDFMTPSGTTFLRSTVLTITVMEYLVSALLFGAVNLRERRPFLHWYSLGLGLIGIGLAGVALQPAVGSPLGWAGRISQSMGQIYTVICLITVVKELQATRSPLGWRIGTSFRQIELEHRAIFEASAEGIWILDAEGIVVYANRRAPEMLACSVDELLGKPMLDLMSSNGSQERERLSRWLAQPEQQGVEIIHHRKDGGEIWIQLNSSPIKDAHGRAWGMLVMMRDVTERKREEEALRETEERLRLTLQASAVGTFEVDLTTGVGQWNAVEYELLGLEPGDAPGGPETFFRYGHPEDVAELRARWEEARRTGRFDAEFRIIRADGQERWLAGKGQFFFTETTDTRSAGGKRSPLRFLGVNFDITERKRAEEAQRRSQERLRAVMESTGDPIFLKDRESRMLMGNPAVFALIGKSEQEVLGKNDAELYPDPAIGNTIMENDRRIMESGQAEVVEEVAQTPWGYRTYLSTKTPWRDEHGGVIGLIGVARDITERKRAEEALQQRTLEIRRLTETLEQRVKDRTADVERERQRLYDVLETLPAMVCLLTPDYHVTFANRSFREKFGDSGGRHCYEYCFGRAQPCEFCESYNVLKTGKPHHWEVTAPDGNGVIDAYDFPFTDVDGLPLILEMDIDITEYRRAEAALKERTAELADLSSQLVSAQESERRRISYDLHDNVWQTLVAIRFSIENLFSRQDKPDWAALHKKSKEVIGNILTAVGKIRSMQGDLWPYVLDDIGMLATIEWYCREFEKTHPGLTIENRVALREEDIPSEAKIVIYRIMQEAMSNVVKHSQAKHVSLLVANKDQKVEFTVVDNGIGFDLEEKLIKRNPLEGLGLLSIKARTELSGGIFGIESVKGKGTTVRASWALQGNG